jgi:hypothetical protein
MSTHVKCQWSIKSAGSAKGACDVSSSVFRFRVQGFGFRVSGSGCRVQGAGFRVHGPGSRVQGSGLKV